MYSLWNSPLPVPYDTAAQSILPQVVPRSDLPAANARLYSVELTANAFVGPPIGGVLVAVGAALAIGTPAALWLVAIPATVLGMTWLVMRGLRDLIPTLSRHWRGHLIYGVYQDDEGRWMVYWHGRKPEPVDWENPPPERVGRGTVVQGVFRRPEG